LGLREGKFLSVYLLVIQRLLIGELVEERCVRGRLHPVIPAVPPSRYPAAFPRGGDIVRIIQICERFFTNAYTQRTLLNCPVIRHSIDI